MSEENQGSEGNKRPNNRNRNRNKNRSKKSGVNSTQTGQNTRPVSNSKKKSKRRPKRRFKLNKEDSTYNKYLTLMDQHLAARKKYFSLFDRSDPQQKAKLERIFISSMGKVRTFEEALPESDKESFQKRVNGLKLDLSYSDLHELDPKHTDVPHDNEPEAPHYMETQRTTNFANDTEESSGSLEDYQAYKGV